jgi:hypothetical protein
MRKLLFTILGIALFLTGIGQDTKPTATTFKQLQSPQFWFNSADTSVWMYKGNVYGWTQLQRTSKKYSIWNHTGITNTGWADGKVLGFNASGNVVPLAASAGGATNLTYTASATDGKVNSDTGTDATIPAGSTTNASLMLPADKTKLNGIASGADNYSGWMLGTGTSYRIVNNTDYINFTAGSGISVTDNEISGTWGTPRRITITATGEYAPLSHVGATGAAHGYATALVAGFMNASDFTKLAGIETGATNYSFNIQANSGATGAIANGNTVTFSQGSNMSISRSGNTLTFSASYAPSMIYPSAGIALSTGSGWSTSIANNSANWNTAYTNMGKVYIYGGSSPYPLNETQFFESGGKIQLNPGTIAFANTLPTLGGTVYSALLLKADLAGADFTGAVKTNAGGIGYSSGAGGTVTQLTSKATGVTLNTLCGQITTFSAALAAAAEATFTVTNSQVAATDVIIVNHKSGGTSGAYLVSVSAVSAGSFSITYSNVSTASKTEAPVFSFVVIKGV